MKEDLVDKETLETKRAQHEEETREKFKLISEQKDAGQGEALIEKVPVSEENGQERRTKPLQVALWPGNLARSWR